MTDFDVQIHQDIHEEIAYHEANVLHGTAPMAIDERFIIPLIRDTATSVAKTIIAQKLSGLKITVD